jgi:hypothetical protein
VETEVAVGFGASGDGVVAEDVAVLVGVWRVCDGRVSGHEHVF